MSGRCDEETEARVGPKRDDENRMLKTEWRIGIEWVNEATRLRLFVLFVSLWRNMYFFDYFRVFLE